MRGGKIRPGRYTRGQRITTKDVPTPSPTPIDFRPAPRLNGRLSAGPTRGMAQAVMAERGEIAPEVPPARHLGEMVTTAGSTPWDARERLKAAKAAGAVPSRRETSLRPIRVATPTMTRDVPDNNDEE